jgi:hypothetical protein
MFVFDHYTVAHIVDPKAATVRWRRRPARIALKVVTFDAVLLAITKNPDGNRFIKLELQGHDFAALRGAERMLVHYVDLSTELAISKRTLYRDVPNRREIVEFLEARGFFLASLFPVLYDDGVLLKQMGSLSGPKRRGVTLTQDRPMKRPSSSRAASSQN